MNRLPLLVALLALSGCVIPPVGPLAPEATPTPAGLPVPVLPVNTQASAGPLGQLRNAGPATTAMNVGEKRSLAPLFLDGKGLVPTTGVVWTSSADAVVGVNPTTGDAFASAKGTAVLTVALQADPSVKAQITVNVSNSGDVTAIAVTPAQATIAIGEAQPLLAKVTLGTGEVKSEVVWSSSDDKIATVDAGGTVTGKAVGTVQILASYAKDPNFKGQAAVRVTATNGTVAASPTPTASADTGGPDTVALRQQGTWVDQTMLTASDFTTMKFFSQTAGVLAGPTTFATTADGGKTWAEHATGLTGVKKVLLQGAGDGWLITDAGIFATVDGTSFPAVVDFKAAYSESLSDVARTSATEAVAITTTGKLFKSTDTGKTWSPVAGPAAALQLLDYNFQNNTTWGPIAAAPGGGLHYAYLNEQSCKNFQTNSYYTCVTAKSYANPDGSGWVTTTMSQGIKAMTFTSAKEGWRNSNQGAVERTVDGGKNWISGNVNGYAMTFLDAQSGVMLYGNTYSVTENDGRTWRATKFDAGYNATAMAVLDLDHMWAVAGNKVKRYLVLPL
ncbi:MAG: Ig domain protein group 2 domain protein [Cyanobacteria bacterium RYN_339]|nr:Ig domain protein group 2 domain protein [Cyanobacteria bacterium RYN_339]